MKKITIFGSGRQKALYRLSVVTSLQEQVSYPHSTKEILQMIQYCKQGGISPEETIITFRTPILTKQPLFWTRTMKEELASSDLVVVEVSSRRAYRYEDRYVHHILYDDPRYRLEDQNNKIVVEILDDATMERDLIAIRDELESHQRLVVIVTEDHGSREELVQELERICERHDILCIHPAEEMEKMGHSFIDYVVPGEESTNFTEAGHDIMETIFKDLLFPSYEKTVVLAWTRRINNLTITITGNFWGLGDLIRGAINSYDEVKKRGLGFYLDLQLHPELQIHWKKKINPYRLQVGEQENNIPFVLSQDMDYFLGHMLTHEMTPFMTNYATDHEASYKARAFVKYYLKPSLEMEKKIDKLQKSLSLRPGKYIVLHYRLGDEELVQHKDPPHLTPHLDSLKYVLKKQREGNEEDVQWLLLSDSESFKNAARRLSLPKLVVLKTKLQHCGYRLSDDLSDTITEFILASRARALFTYSTYPWVSGFIRSIHDLYRIPLVDMKQMKTDTGKIHKMIVVTGSNDVYVPFLLRFLNSYVEHCCLREDTSRLLIVYDLGWTIKQKQSLQKMYAHQYPGQIVFKTFDFSVYPNWMHIQNEFGQFAWKSVILYETMKHYTDTVIVWMDTKNLILNSLQRLEEFVKKHGVYSVTSPGIVADWIHPDTRKVMEIQNDDILLQKHNRNTDCIGVDTNHPYGSSMILEFYRHCMNRNCIAPPESSRKNHRQDQAVFTILFYRIVKSYDHGTGDYNMGFHIPI